MLRRHDFVTPYINGVRFFDKPPLMYWMASSSMAVFGIKDWAARLPLALAVLALLLATYALGSRLFATISPASNPDRGGLYAALAMATAIGPYLYTRFYIPDILLALWMTLAVHLFLIALERITPLIRVPHLRDSSIVAKVGIRAKHEPLSSPSPKSSLLPCIAFAAVLALNVLTKGLIGLVFPIAFVLLYLLLTRQLRLLLKLHPIASALTFVAIAAPWHILAAIRNPPIPLPAGQGLPATGGWAWFYLYNEHIARFLSKRIPHDYGLTPIWLFWLYLLIWIMPWATFLPGAITQQLRNLRQKPSQEAALSLLLWAAVVLGFFSISNRQEYYSLPALPALALMAGGLLAQADSDSSQSPTARRSAQRWHTIFLLPLTTVLAIVCGYYALTAPTPAPHTDIVTLLSVASSTEAYNLSLSHISDLTSTAMGFFRGPLAFTALGLLIVGPVSYLLRRRSRTYAANLTLAAAMIIVLMAAHEGLARFYPILGSKPLAEAINHQQQTIPHPDDLLVLDGELTSGSTLIFYTGQPVHLVNGRVNGLWYGSFWPDSPHIFETESTLHQLWSSPRRIFLMTYTPTTRTRDLTPYGPVHTLATAGGKTILTNQ